MSDSSKNNLSFRLLGGLCQNFRCSLIFRKERTEWTVAGRKAGSGGKYTIDLSPKLACVRVFRSVNLFVTATDQKTYFIGGAKVAVLSTLGKTSVAGRSTTSQRIETCYLLRKSETGPRKRSVALHTNL